jgi:hypothetical protein
VREAYTPVSQEAGDEAAVEERAAPEPPKPSPIGAETVSSYVKEAPTSEAAEPKTQPAAESSGSKQEPSVDAEIAEEGEGVSEEHLLDKLKAPTVEGANTVTLERKRVETKTINIGGEYFDIALYQYQNGTSAARVPRAAIEKMTDIAKQNNLKVLPRHQNAAIMAGRFLGIARAELQERAEKENYHLVDFTDTYYEICFGELPTT